MKPLLLITLLTLFSCSEQTDSEHKVESKMFTENEILHQLDLAFNGTPSEYYPTGQPDDIKYNFFLDLEHGYCETAGSRIHLYADSTKWAVVFEKRDIKIAAPLLKSNLLTLVIALTILLTSIQRETTSQMQAM